MRPTYSLPEAVVEEIAHARYHHPDPRVQERMEILWLKSKNQTHGDIADLAGVSIMTVSRVLNGHPHVTATTRERVEHAVVELGYHANMESTLARAVANGATLEQSFQGEQGGGAQSTNIIDPWGNQIEVLQLG